MSVGNVGQLATDVLLASNKSQFVASLYHPSILPVVGSDPLDLKSDRLMTACQVYKTEKEVILQLRSGLVSSQRDLFLNDLVKWIVEAKFAKVVVLSSSEADERLDCQIRGSQFRFVASSQGLQNDLKSLGLTQLEKRPQDELFLPGTGFAKDLFEKW